MRAVHLPLRLQGHVPVEARKEVEGRHDAPREEVALEDLHAYLVSAAP
jgi:hypothetical protein